jgi:hypothetical protein
VKLRGADDDWATPGPGFCVTALVQPLPAGTTVPFAFGELGLVHICGAETASRLAASEALAGWLGAAPQAGARTMIGAGEDWSVLIGASLREPEIVTPLSGPLEGPPIGLSAVRGFDGTGFAPARGGPTLVMGGFAGPRMQAWSAAAVLIDRLAGWTAEGVAAEGRLAVFGRTEFRDDPTATFAQRMVVRYYAGPGAEGVPPELATFHAWEDEFCAVAAALGPEVPVDFYRMDWNLSGKPAALTRQGAVLVAKGWNLVRVQTPRERYPEVGPAFFERYLPDPMDEERFVPTPPPGGPTCALQGGGL